MLTLNQIISKLETIATNHSQINHFGYGDLWEILEKNSDTPINYALMWVVIGNATKGSKDLSLSFTIIVADLVDKDEANELEVLSDTLLICNDIIAEVKALADTASEDIYFDSNEDGTINLTPFTERFDDELSGWSFDINIRIPYANNACITA